MAPFLLLDKSHCPTSVVPASRTIPLQGKSIKEIGC